MADEILFKLKIEIPTDGKPEGMRKVVRCLITNNMSFEQFSRMLDEFKQKALEAFQARR